MSNPSPEIIEKVKEWLTFADDDIRLARHAAKLKSSIPFRLVAFHAQQCAEKYLKAYLVYKNVDFPYTHSIAVLLKLCDTNIPWVKEIQDTDVLTPYATTARYPGVDREVSKQEAMRAIDLAEKVRQKVRAAFESLGLDLP